MNIYTVRDKASETYGAPWVAHNDITATRQFSQEVNRANELNTLYNNPEDFSLFLIGEFDQQTGRITPVQQKIVAEARAVVKKETK